MYVSHITTRGKRGHEFEWEQGRKDTWEELEEIFKRREKLCNYKLKNYKEKKELKRIVEAKEMAQHLRAVTNLVKDLNSV